MVGSAFTEIGLQAEIVSRHDQLVPKPHVELIFTCGHKVCGEGGADEYVLKPVLRKVATVASLELFKRYHCARRPFSPGTFLRKFDVSSKLK